MTHAIREVSQVRCEISIEIPAAEWSGAVAAATRDASRKVRLPGFRPGKVPAEVVRKMFGAEIESEVFDRLVPDRCAKALQEAGVAPLSRPTIQEKRLPDGAGSGLAVTLSFEVRPKLAMSGYKGLELTRRATTVTDAAVDAALEELREQAARFVAIEGRPVVAGDYVVVDMTPDHGAKEHNVLVHVKEGPDAKDLDRALPGHVPGDELTIDVTERHEGGSAEEGHPHGPHDHHRTFRTRIREIKVRELPALDDGFAREVGPYEGLDALKRKLRDDLVRQGERDARRALVHQALDKLLETTTVLAPDILVDRELEREIQAIAEGFRRRGLPADRLNLDWERMAREIRPMALKNVLLELVFDAIADAEAIPVPQDKVEAHIREAAEAARRSPEAVRAQLVKDGQLAVLEASMRREASIDLVLDHARVASEV